MSAKVLARTAFASWRPTASYVKSFGVDINESEANKMGFLVNGSCGGKWYRLDWLRDVEKSQRKIALMAFANEKAAELRLQRPF